MGGDDRFGELEVGRLARLQLEAPTGVVSLIPGEPALEELWLAVRWGGSS
jgi:hypothetical protein